MEHVNTRGVIGDESALVKAAQEGHRPRIESLLAAGADVNEVNGAGETAVMKAAEARNSRCLQLLVNAGADVNARDCNGVTAFLKAAWAYNVECMSILLKAGADVNYLSEDLWKSDYRSDGCSRNQSPRMCEIPNRNRS